MIPSRAKNENYYISGTVWPILTICTPCDVFLCKDMLFGGCIDIAPSFNWGQMPRPNFFVVKIGVFSQMR